MRFLFNILQGNWLSQEIIFELTVLARLILAAICGGLIGLEREMKGRPAGLKTFSLVCVGATLAMITNE